MDCISGWCRSKRRLDGYTAIVTGSNTGIGKETAIDFYLRGARVILACRDVQKAEAAKQEIENTHSLELNKGSLTVEKLDVSSLQSVRDFVNRISANELKVHILVNNAGVMMCPRGKTEDGFETHIGTNHFGHALLTLLLLPKMRASAPARVVFVSSILHNRFELDLDDWNFEKKRYNALQAYSYSKSANIVFARALANKLKEHNITDVTTYSLHPGVIRTEIGRHFSDTMGFGTSWLFRNVFGVFLKSPRCGAQTTIYCALDESCQKQSGLYYSDCAVKAPTKACQNDEVAAKFWDITIAALKLQDYNPFGKL